MLARTPGIAQDENGELNFTDWNCRAGQNNVIIRTDGHRRAVFPDVSLNVRLGKYRQSKVRPKTAPRDEAHLSATLLLHSESQPWLLLERCASPQVGLDPGGHEPHEGRGEKFRGLNCHSTFGRTISNRSVVRVYCIPPMRPIISRESRSMRPSCIRRSSI